MGWPSARAVHPHTRGEHTLPRGLDVKAGGSSPHTWGTPARCSHWYRRRRFIPTHVGNTVERSQELAGQPVHPHTRGEHCTSPLWSTFLTGSSPHTWGTLLVKVLLLGVGRFIPTHVGNTAGHGITHSMKAVHPHTRGEHQSRPPSLWMSGGSSPHTWGTPSKKQAIEKPTRFIPTHVGNTAC